MSFLKAEWRKLAMANYAIDPVLLKPYIPAHTELDLWEGTCYVSLVGFMFLNTRVLGIKVPGHTNFEEVNLRFYVRHKDGEEWKRGVVFVKEIVPRWALTTVANWVYGEHYQTMAMAHDWKENKDERIIRYRWRCRQRWQTFEVATALNPVSIVGGSEAEFITEHYWGYTKISDTQTNEYQVTHPSWEQYPVKSHAIEVDYGLVYGSDFAFLNELEPTSVLVAEGSEITVESKRRL